MENIYRAYKVYDEHDNSIIKFLENLIFHFSEQYCKQLY